MYCIMRRDLENAIFLGVVHPGVGLWPQNSNSAEIYVRCTCPPSFIIMCLLIRKLLCWQTQSQTHTQTNRSRRKRPTFSTKLRCWVKINGFTYWSFQACTTEFRVLRAQPVRSQLWSQLCCELRRLATWVMLPQSAIHRNLTTRHTTDTGTRNEYM